MPKIRLILKEIELVKDKDGDVISIVKNYKTRDYELTDYILNSAPVDTDKRKCEIVSAEFID